SASSPFFLSRSPDLRALHSFPTRRSSDLTRADAAGHKSFVQFAIDVQQSAQPGANAGTDVRAWPFLARRATAGQRDNRRHRFDRSEEHTSELQSRFDLVCRLLLEKKKSHR